MALITGNNGGVTLRGGVQDDTILGGTGNDSILGGDGADSIQGGLGNDTLYGNAGDDYIDGSDGDDKFFEQSSGKDTLIGGAGNDDFNAYTGTGNKYIDGGSGNDTAYGGSGNDTLIGGEGDDKLTGSSGNDSLIGGNGKDQLIDQADGQDTLLGGDGDDNLNVYTGTGNKYLDAGSGNDTLYGGTGADTLLGDDGNDYLDGNESNDSLNGGSGNDTLTGKDGNDTLIGGLGNDSLIGGAGDDTYYIDSIFDFVSDSAGIDTAYVSESFVKIPSSIEKIIYTNGAQALPYWISALLPDEASGKIFTTLVGEAKKFGYIFPSSIPAYDTSADHANGYTGFSLVQQARTIEAFNYISTLVDLQFEKVTDASTKNTIVFASNIQSKSAGYALYPSSSFLGSDVFLNISSSNTLLADNTYGALVLIHEIGHALGLEHPFKESNNNSHSDSPHLSDSEEDGIWTVMSYDNTSAQYYLKYSPLDIAALQYLYGPSKKSRVENNTYKVNASSANFIWDGSGNDSIDASAIGQAVTIYLTPGYHGYVGTTKSETITSAGQVTVNFGTLIENLLGSKFDDHLFGNEVNNQISGDAGNDSIEGWSGADTLLGGDGNDLLNGGQGNDSLDGGRGQDTLIVADKFENYTFAYNALTNNYSIDGKTGIEGTDTFTSIEFIKFSDKTISIQDLNLLKFNTLSGQIYQWNTHALLSGVQISMPKLEASVMTNDAGTYKVQGLEPNSYELSVTKTLTTLETGSAISSADALAALKIAVGRNPNLDGAAISPYQLIAADVNQDGKVTSADALAILKMAVKRTDAPTREWLFVNESQDFWDEAANGGQGGLTISRTNVTWNKDLQATVSKDTTVNLLAVLKGDVNGSWIGASGTQSLPNSYFTDLVAKGLGPLSTWGVVMA